MSWADAVSEDLGGTHVISSSPSGESGGWEEAAAECVTLSQSTEEDIEEAECFRRSGSVQSLSSAASEMPLAPELFWLQPLKSVLARHVGHIQAQNLTMATGPLRVASACTGTCAEGSVLKARCFGRLMCFSENPNIQDEQF